MISADRWFNASDLTPAETPIILNELRGYVLPHAPTKESGNIISHTLRFQPGKPVSTVVILYCSGRETMDVVFPTGESYHHELYVPLLCMEWALDQWKVDRATVRIVAVNVMKPLPSEFAVAKKRDSTIVVVSAGFSHGAPMNLALEAENVAAQALQFKNLEDRFMDGVVDDPRTFAALFYHFPDLGLQWVGRTRSLTGAGHLTFLIVEAFHPKEEVTALFVTVYDANMRARESLGEWFGVYTLEKEEAWVQKVLRLAETTSRLTNGAHRSVPVNYCTVTYLYKTTLTPFIRGWHSVKGNLTYLAQVFLENTFDNGVWINDSEQTVWQADGIFRMDRTLVRMTQQSKCPQATPLECYETYVVNYSID